MPPRPDSPTPDRSPNRPPHEVLAQLIDLIAEAKTCLLIAAATAPRDPERAARVEELKKAIGAPRQLANEILNKAQALPEPLLVELRMCELAIPALEAGAVLRMSGRVASEGTP